MNLLQELRNDAVGLAILEDWLGDGGSVVPRAEANARAATCLNGCNGAVCPENRAPKWWETSKDVIASFIKKQLELKNRMAIACDHEDALHMCRACGCCLKLKVHVPIEHIRAYTLLETLTKYPDHCWIKKELLA